MRAYQHQTQPQVPALQAHLISLTPTASLNLALTPGLTIKRMQKRAGHPHQILNQTLTASVLLAMACARGLDPRVRRGR